MSTKWQKRREYKRNQEKKVWFSCMDAHYGEEFQGYKPNSYKELSPRNGGKGDPWQEAKGQGL